MKMTEFLLQLAEVSGRNGQYMACCPCPAHNDKSPSLSVKDGGDRIVFHCHGGCTYDEILSSMGLEARDLFYNSTAQADDRWTFICEYYYTSALKKIRWLKPNGDKVFTWKHSNNKQDGIWKNGKGGQVIPLYNQSVLTTTKPSDTVYLVEGEKDVDTLKVNKKIAVCSPHGATKGTPKGKWLPEYTAMLKGYNVAILQDNDDIGKIYAKTVAAALHGITASVKVIDLTCQWNDLKLHGDITDVFEMENKNQNFFMP